MAHPFQDHRQSKVEHGRVAQLTKGYAAGGAVHDDASADAALIRKTVKKAALRVDGDGAKGRADRPGRARGGPAPKKGAKTNAKVMVAGHGGAPAAPAMAPPPGPMPMAALPPRPAMMPPPGAGPGLPPGMPPGAPGMPPRRSGGRAYAAGGAVKFGAAFEEGRKAGTQVTHSPGKNDAAGLNRGKPMTYKTGAPVPGPQGGGPGPQLPRR